MPAEAISRITRSVSERYTGDRGNFVVQRNGNKSSQHYPRFAPARDDNIHSEHAVELQPAQQNGRYVGSERSADLHLWV